MAVTLSALEDIFYDILREPQDTGGWTSAYPLTMVDDLLNAAQQNILSGRVVNAVTKEEVRKWDIHFQKTEVFYSNIPWGSLASDAVIGWTTLSCGDTTNYPSTWHLYIAGNIITYTWNTGTGFTGCSWILFTHLAGTQFSILHELPADYGSVINVIYKNKVKLPQKNYDDIFEDLNSYKGTTKNRSKAIWYYDQPYRVAPFYTIIDATYILVFNFDDLNAMIKVRYEKTPTLMTSTWTPVNCAIDNDLYARTTIPYLAVGEMMYNRWEEERGAQLISFAIRKIKEMYDWYNSTDHEKISGTHYLMWRWKLNI